MRVGIAHKVNERSVASSEIIPTNIKKDERRGEFETTSPRKFMEMRTLLHIAKTPTQKYLRSYKVLIGMFMRPRPKLEAWNGRGTSNRASKAGYYEKIT
jgi:hypothetical protein